MNNILAKSARKSGLTHSFDRVIYRCQKKGADRETETSSGKKRRIVESTESTSEMERLEDYKKEVQKFIEDQKTRVSQY